MFEDLLDDNPRFNEEDMTDTEFELFEILKTFQKRVETANSGFKRHGMDGNWDVTDYTLGMYNGMSYIMSIIEGREPDYRSFPPIAPILNKRADVVVDFVGSDSRPIGFHDGNDNGAFDGRPSDVDQSHPNVSANMNIYPELIEGEVFDSIAIGDSDDSNIDLSSVEVDPEFLNRD